MARKQSEMQAATEHRKKLARDLIKVLGISDTISCVVERSAVEAKTIHCAVEHSGGETIKIPYYYVRQPELKSEEELAAEVLRQKFGRAIEFLARALNSAQVIGLAKPTQALINRMTKMQKRLTRQLPYDPARGILDAILDARRADCRS